MRKRGWRLIRSFKGVRRWKGTNTRVMTGFEQWRNHARLRKMAQQDELGKRIRGLVSSHTSDFEGYLSRMMIRKIPKEAGAFPYHRGINHYVENHPDVALAAIDIFEELKKIENPGAREHCFRASHFYELMNFHRPFTMQLRFVTPEAHRVAAEVESIVNKVGMAYDPSVMKRLDMDVGIIEEPVYVSPRIGMTALETPKTDSENFQELKQAANEQNSHSDETIEVLAGEVVMRERRSGE